MRFSSEMRIMAQIARQQLLTCCVLAMFSMNVPDTDYSEVFNERVIDDKQILHPADTSAGNEAEEIPSELGDSSSLMIF